MTAPGYTPILCIIGKKNSGKTGVTVRLARELRGRGRRVMTVKHGHGFDLDRPGTDSWRHRHEGDSFRTVVAAPAGFAVVGDWPGEEMSLEAIVRAYLSDAEIVLAEGYKASGHPKVEVFRSQAHRAPLSDLSGSSASSLLAVVTDVDGLEAGAPVLRLDDPSLAKNLADLVERSLLHD